MHEGPEINAKFDKGTSMLIIITQYKLTLEGC